MVDEVNVHRVEISDWADISHRLTDKPEGGIYIARTKEGDWVGEMKYFWYNDERTLMMLMDVNVHENYVRRRVATALLRYMNLDHPQARINPGQRSREGQAFMDHILTNEAEKVATNGVQNIPLQTFIPPAFSPNNPDRMVGLPSGPLW